MDVLILIIFWYCMEKLHPEILHEITRRLGMRNRAALEATSRTVRAALRPMTAEITRETKAALCRALKIAFEIRQVMREFRAMPRFARDWATDPQRRIAFKEALDAYVARVKARAQPGEGAELEWNTLIYEKYIACLVQSLFVGSINGTRISVAVVIQPETLEFVAHTGIMGRTGILGHGVSGIHTIIRNPSKIPEIYRPGVNTGTERTERETVARVKKDIRITRRKIKVNPYKTNVKTLNDILLDRLLDRLPGAKAYQSRPVTIALKVVDRAIKACATSLYATMW